MCLEQSERGGEREEERTGREQGQVVPLFDLHFIPRMKTRGLPNYFLL